MKKIFFALLLMFSVHKIYPGLFSSYDKKSPEDNVRDLAIEQINNPEDPYINYNLGVALYQTRKYDSAKNNFERAVKNAKNKKLKERSYFNLANSCYKNALSGLPVNWESESTKIEQDKLSFAIENAKQAVKNYESLLALNKENEQAKTNLKKAKELLEKLMKKQQQQKQDQKQDDKKDQDKKKDEQDKQNQKDKSKQDQQNQQNQQDQQPQKDQQDKSKQDQQSKEQSKQDKQEQQEQEASKDQKQNQDKSEEQKSDEQKEAQQSKESEQQAMQQAQQALGQETQKESAEEKSMRLMLENLQSDEDSLQKLIIQRQTRDQKPLKSGQKPW